MRATTARPHVRWTAPKRRWAEPRELGGACPCAVGIAVALPAHFPQITLARLLEPIRILSEQYYGVMVHS